MYIDFVLLWVDGNDRDWRDLKNKYAKDGQDVDDSENRYRDWDILKYWFRSVEKNAPWVHKIYFVTCGQTPSWLNTEHEKIVLVNHKDFMPEEYLPTFSSHPIEWNMHRIKGLSEHFVYFNDDMFLGNVCSEEDFFKDGLPCDQAVEEPYSFNERTVFNDILANNMVVINSHFNRKEILKKYHGKFYNLKDGRAFVKNTALSVLKRDDFFGFEYQHIPQPFLKSMFERVWEENAEWIDETCHNRFRSRDDISPYVIKFYQFLTGEFSPVNIRKNGLAIHLDDEKEKNIGFACESIVNKKYKLLCLNDARVRDFEAAGKLIREAFETVYPEKCSFEL